MQGLIKDLSRTSTKEFLLRKQLAAFKLFLQIGFILNARLGSKCAFGMLVLFTLKF